MKEIFYKQTSNEIEVFNKAAQNKIPILLKGPTGCGKSRFVEYMAAKFDQPLYSVACNEDTSASDLIGRYLIKGGETYWQDGPVSQAIKDGGVLYLDEVAEAREDVLVVLHSLSDHRREIYVDKTGETLKAQDNFIFVVSFNPGYQSGLKELKPSTRQRFISLNFNYPEAKIEQEIIEKESLCIPTTAQSLVRLATAIRRIKDLDLKETVSTRLLVYAGLLITSGLHPREACEVTIVQSLSDDIDVTKALKDLAALHF